MRFKGRMDHVPHIRMRSGPRLLLRAGGQLRGCLQEKAGMGGGGRMIGYFIAGCIVGGCVSFIAMCIVIGGSE